MAPGGGGLVILPHKSWNVWNRDNKAKVARDEAANAQLIEAKDKCRNKVLQEIRFERLTGETVTKEEQQQRIEDALDNININDYIKDQSMQEIATNINDKIQRETMNGTNKLHKKRKHYDMNLTEEERTYKPRKRHKRNDVSIIEDHYNHKSIFKFDPKRYNNNTNNNTNSSNNNDYKNEERMKEEKIKKECDDYQFKFGRTEIESRSNKAWYMMRNQKERERRMLMKSDDIQHSLPRRLREYKRNTNQLREKAIVTKKVNDPLHLMHKYLKATKNKDIHQETKKKKRKKKRKHKEKHLKSSKKNKRRS